MAFETWIGANLLSGMAGELGAPMVWVSVLASAPWLGQFGQALGVGLRVSGEGLKRACLLLATSARLLWLVPLGFVLIRELLPSRFPGPFPLNGFFALLGVTACTSAVLLNLGSVAWNSWMRELIPGSIRGRFLGLRQRSVQGAVVLAHAVAASLVGFSVRGRPVGYALLGLLAVLHGLNSSRLLARVPAAPSGPRPVGHPIRAAIGVLREPQFRGLLLCGAAFQFSMTLAGPYFAYYFTRGLGIPMSTVSLWTALTALGFLLAAPFWGRMFDRTRHPRLWISVCAALVGISPLWYLSPDAQIIRLLAPAEFLTNGFAWAGYQLCMSALLFRLCPPRQAPVAFALYGASVGIAGTLGTWMGGWLVPGLEPWGGFRALFALASLARLGVVAGLFLRLLPGGQSRRLGLSTRSARIAATVSTDARQS